MHIVYVTNYVDITSVRAVPDHEALSGGGDCWSDGASANGVRV